MTRRTFLLAAAQASDVPLFRSETNLVRVSAQVLAAGRLVPGLGPADFVVRENGVLRPVEAVATDQEPMDLLILLDISGSMKPHLVHLAAGANKALQQLTPGDRAAIAGFHEWTDWVIRFTADLKTVVDRLIRFSNKMWAGGGTFTTDALHVAANYVRRHGRGGCRRAILVISDNAGSGSGLFDYNKALTMLLENEITVNALIVTEARGEVDLRNVAGHTGGYVLSDANAGPAFAEILALIRRSYAVFFRPAVGRAGERRRAVVELTPAAAARHPRARINAVREYVLNKTIVQ